MIGLVFRLFVAFWRLVALPWRSLRRRRACPPGVWVRLKIGGELAEAPRPKARFWARPRRAPTSLYRVRQLVDAMLDDPSPAGLVVRVRGLRAPSAYREGLREELARLKAAGRPVVLWLPEGGSAAELSLAGGASTIFVGAKTTLGPLGLRAGSIYLRRALERAGVRPEVLARGSFKTAFENLTRDDMSEAHREQLGRLLDVFYDDLVGSLAAGRAVSAEQARAWLDLGMVRADEAARLGLVDAALYDDEVPERLGAGPARPARFVPAGRYLARRLAPLAPLLKARPRVVVVEARGAIVERAPPYGAPVCDAERLTDLARALERDGRVAAVVLHVDSPGGGALASDRMHRAFVKLAAKKPLVACLGGVAASGGYYIASAAHCIVARPSSVTGSIGVVAARPLLGPLLARFGAAPRYLVRGRRAEMLDPLRPLSEDERARFEADLEATYLDFLAAVAAGRGKSPDEIRPLAGGRVWAGVDALERGLVDRLGGLAEAVGEACARLNVAPADVDLVTVGSPGVPPWSPRAWVGQALAEALLPEGFGQDARLALALHALASREHALALWTGVELD
ncbi:MAG TPA: S49 family peptidase [Polyangiaceae bacterium]|nr:S49 family peptidase [Polyangiaceae bacterium]